MIALHTTVTVRRIFSVGPGKPARAGKAPFGKSPFPAGLLHAFVPGGTDDFRTSIML